MSGLITIYKIHTHVSEHKILYKFDLEPKQACQASLSITVLYFTVKLRNNPKLVG